MASQTGKKIITTHILPNISRIKGNQAIKFGQLIEYQVTNLCILSKDAGHRPACLLKMSLFQMRFSNILLVKTN